MTALVSLYALSCLLPDDQNEDFFMLLLSDLEIRLKPPTRSCQTGRNALPTFSTDTPSYDRHPRPMENKHGHRILPLWSQ
ncbi:hypothetical protein K504DRAFT_464388 [Pleomassaria siparia CBS 279.74]|uniref:Uncharacterized protein n=1 Tax=Pleomassaria siparia CBS 279.74 TaxID=1314801 RepID=A0A6G1KIS5_9PLEO|nr:hypothetical protein K504DRAFT_464388 [Pleomassaria siparia CBS 279.74]